MVYPHRHPHPPRPTLNAIVHGYRLKTDPAHETAEEERIRHMRTCQALIERGMDLAHEAADHAHADMRARPPGPSIPYSAAAAIEQAEARARLRQPNYGTVFAQLSRSVRQSMALQAHIRAGRPTPQPRTPTESETRPDRATQPDRPESPPRRDALERPDWTLPILPDGELDVEQLLETIRKDLDVHTSEAIPRSEQHPTPTQAEHPDTGEVKRPSHRPPAAPQPPRTWRPPIGNPATA